MYKSLKLSVIGPRDLQILNKCVEKGIQNVNINFVESADDVRYVKKLLGTKGQHIALHARIKTLKGLQKIEKIIEEADGIQIQRGYLGMEMSHTNISYVIEHIMKRCKTEGKVIGLPT